MAGSFILFILKRFSRKTFRRRALQKIVGVCHTMHIHKHHLTHIHPIRILSIRIVSIRIHSIRIPPMRIRSKGMHQQEWQCITPCISISIIPHISIQHVSCQYVSFQYVSIQYVSHQCVSIQKVCISRNGNVCKCKKTYPCISLHQQEWQSV